MEPFVSVIVPVFRVERYLDECVDSLIGQTLKNIEIILIDDGSDDNCPALCDKYQMMYSHVRVIHQKNKGSSAARNAGLLVAKGKYIAFCDSDDTMKPNMLEVLYQCAEEQNVDIVICGFETVPDGKINVRGYALNQKMSSEELICSNHKIHSGNDLCFSWSFLIKNSLIKEKQIVFDEKIRFGEDFLFNLSCVMEAESIYVLPKILYNYRINNKNSIMRQKYKADLEKQIQEQYELKIHTFEKYGLDKNKEFMDDFAFYYVAEWGFAGMLFRNVLAGPKEERKDSLKRIVRLSCLSDNYKRMGKNILMYGKRNAAFWFACKHHIDFLIEKMSVKIFENK